MSCESDLQAVLTQLDAVRAQNAIQRMKIAEIRTENNFLLALVSASQQVSQPGAVIGAVTQPTAPTAPTVRGEERRATQPQKEERAVGSDELAQYAALTRDITDMEARLDRLEAR